MFKKKRKTLIYRINYGKSPSFGASSFRRRSSGKLLKKSHPFMNKIKKLAAITLITATTIVLVNLFLFSGYFLITDIALAENSIENQTIGNEIKAKITDALGKNLVFLDKEEYKLKILNAFPEIENLELKKDYPKTLLIEFSEYPLTANVINESANIKKSYIINSIGYAVKEDLENANLPYIRIRSDEPINTDMPVIDSTTLNYISDTVKYFEDKFGMRIVEAQYKRTAREVHLLTEKDFYIWLDIQRPAERQLKKLKKALVKLDIYTEVLQYIDLRIAGASGDKIIYKRK